jgi:hypothetical protein
MFSGVAFVQVVNENYLSSHFAVYAKPHLEIGLLNMQPDEFQWKLLMLHLILPFHSAHCVCCSQHVVMA